MTEATEPGIAEAPPAGARLSAWGILAITEAGVAVAGWALVACRLFGALVALCRPRLAVGWLFCGFALCYGLSAAAISLVMWQASAGGPNPWSSTLGWLEVFIWTRR